MHRVPGPPRTCRPHTAPTPRPCSQILHPGPATPPPTTLHPGPCTWVPAHGVPLQDFLQLRAGPWCLSYTASVTFTAKGGEGAGDPGPFLPQTGGLTLLLQPLTLARGPPCCVPFQELAVSWGRRLKCRVGEDQGSQWDKLAR